MQYQQRQYPTNLYVPYTLLTDASVERELPQYEIEEINEASYEYLSLGGIYKVYQSSEGDDKSKKQRVGIDDSQDHHKSESYVVIKAAPVPENYSEPGDDIAYLDCDDSTCEWKKKHSKHKTKSPKKSKKSAPVEKRSSIKANNDQTSEEPSSSDPGDSKKMDSSEQKNYQKKVTQQENVSSNEGDGKYRATPSSMKHRSSRISNREDNVPTEGRPEESDFSGSKCNLENCPRRKFGPDRKPKSRKDSDVYTSEDETQLRSMTTQASPENTTAGTQYTAEPEDEIPKALVKCECAKKGPSDLKRKNDNRRRSQLPDEAANIPEHDSRNEKYDSRNPERKYKPPSSPMKRRTSLTSDNDDKVACEEASLHEGEKTGQPPRINSLQNGEDIDFSELDCNLEQCPSRQTSPKSLQNAEGSETNCPNSKSDVSELTAWKDDTQVKSKTTQASPEQNTAATQYTVEPLDEMPEAAVKCQCAKKFPADTEKDGRRSRQSQDEKYESKNRRQSLNDHQNTHPSQKQRHPEDNPKKHSKRKSGKKATLDNEGYPMGYLRCHNQRSHPGGNQTRTNRKSDFQDEDEVKEEKRQHHQSAKVHRNAAEVDNSKLRHEVSNGKDRAKENNLRTARVSNENSADSDDEDPKKVDQKNISSNAPYAHGFPANVSDGVQICSLKMDIVDRSGFKKRQRNTINIFRSLFTTFQAQHVARIKLSSIFQFNKKKKKK